MLQNLQQVVMKGTLLLTIPHCITVYNAYILAFHFIAFVIMC
jgi:hypothetical protein